MSVRSNLSQVFISYASADRPVVQNLAMSLEQAGISVWMDDRNLQGGTRWAEEIVKAIKGCKVLLLACSDASMRSWAVKQEIQLAGEARKPLLPLMLAPSHFPEQLEFFLAGLQRIDVSHRPPSEWFPSLLHALETAGVHSSGVAATKNSSESAAWGRPTWTLNEIRRLARFTDQLWPVQASEVPRRKGLRGLGAPQENVRRGFRLGSRMRLVLESDHPGHLLLIDEGAEGTLYCLCPSHFAPDTRLEIGCNLFPQATSPYDSFELTGLPGREELLAIITEEPLPLDWMPQDSRVPARVLVKDDVEQLMTLLRSLPTRAWVALSTYFDVIEKE